MVEEFNCIDCKYDDKHGHEEPCYRCKNGVSPLSPTYETTPLLWEAKVANDPVNHPSHYTNGGMECIEEMQLVFGDRVVADFCLCNAWKYRYRAISKNGEEDMKKSHWYMAKYKELTEKKEGYF